MIELEVGDLIKTHDGICGYVENIYDNPFPSESKKTYAIIWMDNLSKVRYTDAYLQSYWDDGTMTIYKNNNV